MLSVSEAKAMAHPRGPTKVDFLKKVKGLIVAAYDGNIGENRHFTLTVSSNEYAEISVKYHTCEEADVDDNVALKDLGSDSAWKRSAAPPMAKKDCKFMAKHNLGMTLAQTVQRECKSVMSIILCSLKQHQNE